LHKGVRTILEKTGKFAGRLRTQKTNFLAGEKNLEALYRENGCEFRFNVESCYFSSRLASERLEIAKNVKKGENVLVMFGGVAPYAIVIGKFSHANDITSVELGKQCNKYAQINVKRNKLQNKISLIQGDVRKKVPKMKEKFNRIVMARPNLSDSFLDIAFRKIAKNGIIHYYGFYEGDKLNEMRELIEREAKRAGKRIKILKIKKAGDIGAYRYRYRADIKLIN